MGRRRYSSWDETVTLRNWQDSGWLKEHATSKDEIANKLEMVTRDLEQCQIPDLHADWRLSIAQRCILTLAEIALFASGYRAARNRHHERTLESLRYTLELDNSTVALLQTLRQKRNVAEYDSAGTISDREAENAFSTAKELDFQVRQWLESKYPNLI